MTNHIYSDLQTETPLYHRTRSTSKFCVMANHICWGFQLDSNPNSSLPLLNTFAGKSERESKFNIPKISFLVREAFPHKKSP